MALAMTSSSRLTPTERNSHRNVFISQLYSLGKTCEKKEEKGMQRLVISQPKHAHCYRKTYFMNFKSDNQINLNQ